MSTSRLELRSGVPVYDRTPKLGIPHPTHPGRPVTVRRSEDPRAFEAAAGPEAHGPVSSRSCLPSSIPQRWDRGTPTSSCFFLHHRCLLDKLARAAWQTVLNLMIEISGDATLRLGMRAVGVTHPRLLIQSPRFAMRTMTSTQPLPAHRIERPATSHRAQPRPTPGSVRCSGEFI